MVTAVSPVFRNATPDDVDAIFVLLVKPAAEGLVLPRSPVEIVEMTELFIVAEQAGNVIGCVMLKDYGDGLQELRSLAVSPAFQGCGIGSQLVDEAVKRARDGGTSRVFALTYRPHLFERLAFKRVQKRMFPQKVWDDCRRCRKREHCDETAVLLQCRPMYSKL